MGEEKDKILNFIRKYNGTVGKNDIVRHMKGIAARRTVFGMLTQLESEKKINVLKGDKRGQSYYFSINEQNQFNIIKNELSELSEFIKKMNLYLNRRSEEFRRENEEKSNSDNENTMVEFENQTNFMDSLEFYYKQTISRMLDDVYHISVTTAFYKEEVEIFLKEIINLKSSIQYHSWRREWQKNSYNMDRRNIQNLIRRYEKGNVLGNYIDDKLVKDKFTEPLIKKINSFQVFLDT